MSTASDAAIVHLLSGYLILMFSVLSTLLRRNRRDRARSYPRLALVFTIVLMFLMSTSLWAMDIADVLGPIQAVLVDSQGSFSERFSGYIYTEQNNRVVAQTFIYTFELMSGPTQFLIGDAVVVWRAGALWAFDIKIIVAPLITLTAGVEINGNRPAMFFLFVGCTGHTGWKLIDGEQARLCNHAQAATFFLSLGTNAMATSLIAYKAWLLRQSFARAYSPQRVRRSRTLTEKILMLFVESGFIYLCFWISKSFTYFPLSTAIQASAYFGSAMLNSAGNQVVGLYPTIIIAIVARHQTNWDAPVVSLEPLTVNTGSNVGEMQFVPHTETLATSPKTPASVHVRHSVAFATGELESESSQATTSREISSMI
ncbi:uncharacterized protein EV420DRAFT_1472849 [Desarmillaria tabescens]|uniref:Uncharacterized protein n=1 Tax=Armillaria tabescens TaxID=1929756 RepID=A0AA39U8M7_ARMTA|nr:uncharacterized protein EV420DRAFT_1472849 [Desarmillaria tabescens]KAK0469665.1 hypothetical protein EV420DRAFT_1472849 [Desarmillaria tabescens]